MKVKLRETSSFRHIKLPSGFIITKGEFVDVPEELTTAYIRAYGDNLEYREDPIIEPKVEESTSSIENVEEEISEGISPQPSEPEPPKAPKRRKTKTEIQPEIKDEKGDSHEETD